MRLSFKALIISFVLLSSNIYAEETLPFYFYLPVQEEINAFFNLSSYLNEYNKNTFKAVNEKLFRELFDISIEYNNILQTHYLLHFIKTTPNKSIINYFINFSKGLKKMPPNFEQTLEILKQKEFSQKFITTGKNFNDVRYSDFVEISLFDNQLITMLPNNQWRNILVTNKSDIIDDKSFIGFLSGSGTNSFLASYRYYNETEQEFISRVKKERFDAKNFKNNILMEIPVEDFLKLSNADKIYLWIGSYTDVLSIKNGQMVLNIFSTKYRRGYEITWLINFSPKSLHYENPEYIFSYMSKIILFNRIY